jgi:hypothetical protein
MGQSEIGYTVPGDAHPTERAMAGLRLGDEIDDFCVKCRRITNHLIVSLLNDGPAKVRCRTCYSDHDYRHEKAPPSKKDLRKEQLFHEVLSSIDPAAALEEQKARKSESSSDAKTSGDDR